MAAGTTSCPMPSPAMTAMRWFTRSSNPSSTANVAVQVGEDLADRLALDVVDGVLPVGAALREDVAVKIVAVDRPLDILARLGQYLVRRPEDGIEVIFDAAHDQNR